MTPEERDLIVGLFGRLRAADAPGKDAEAEALIARQIQVQPSAPYLLVQIALVQEHALTNAQARIAELERQLDEAKRSASLPATTGGSSFLGPWGRAPAQAAQPQPAYQSPPAYQPAPAYQQPYPTTSGMAPGAGGGFLRSALTTAAGVAGGALLFEGISNLLGHNAGPFGGGMAGGGFGAPREEIIEETTINNYYGTPPGGVQRSDYVPDQGSDPSVQDADYSVDDSDTGGFGDDDSYV